MKRIYLVLAIAGGLVACGDNSSNMEGGTGGSIDSNYSAPATDNTTVQPDTSLSDTNRTLGDTTMRKAGDGASGQGAAGGTSSGQAGSGSSTNSNNSGSATDDNKGNN